MKYLISHWIGLDLSFPNMSTDGTFTFIEIENLGEWILQNSKSSDIMVVSVDRYDLPSHRIILDNLGKRFRTR